MNMRVVTPELTVFIIVLCLGLSCTPAGAKRFADKHIIEQLGVAVEQTGKDCVSYFVDLIDSISGNIGHMTH